MPIYRLIEKRNPSDKKASQKYYASSVKTGTKKLRDITKEITDTSAMEKKEINNILARVIEIIPHYLLQGESVNLGELGTMRLSFSSEGVEIPDDFNPDMIKNVKVIFTPATALKKKIASAKFEKQQIGDLQKV